MVMKLEVDGLILHIEEVRTRLQLDDSEIAMLRVPSVKHAVLFNCVNGKKYDIWKVDDSEPTFE